MFRDLLIAFGVSFMSALLALLPITNPPSMAPIFLNLTAGASDDIRKNLAKRIAKYSFLMMLGAMLTGSVVLDFFGISLHIVRVGGGIIVMAAGWSLLNKPETQADESQRLAENFSPDIVKRRAFYPMTFPLTVGAGAISTTITVGVTLPDPDIAIFSVRLLGAVSGLFAVAVIIYLSFRYAQLILRPLGETGTNVLLRLFAFILLCLGVQITWTGISELIREFILTLPH